MGHDNGDDVETSKRETLAELGRWARVEALHAIPRPVLIATLMQHTLVTRRSSALLSFCSMSVSSAHPAQAARSDDRVDAQTTCGPLLDFL